MADETAMPNGVNDYQMAEENFYDLDQGENETKLKQKIESLETEKYSLADENKGIKYQVAKLAAEIESLKSEESSLKLRIAELGREVEKSEETQRTLESIAGRAVELETSASRLQHDLISAVSEGDEAHKEVAELKRVVSQKEVQIEEVKKEKAETEMKAKELERKVGVLELKEIGEKNKKVRLGEEMREKMSEKDMEIFDCKKRIEELESQVVEKESLENKLRETEEKVKEMEGKLVELQKEVQEAEKVVGGLQERTGEVINGIEIKSREKGFKVQPPVVAIGSVGAILAAAAVIYVCYARRR
jgi:chromosome segregation ATPase